MAWEVSSRGSLQNPEAYPKKGGPALIVCHPQSPPADNYSTSLQRPGLPPNLPVPGSNPGRVGDQGIGEEEELESQEKDNLHPCYLVSHPASHTLSGLG